MYPQQQNNNSRPLEGGNGSQTRSATAGQYLGTNGLLMRPGASAQTSSMRAAAGQADSQTRMMRINTQANGGSSSGNMILSAGGSNVSTPGNANGALSAHIARPSLT